MPGDEVVVVGAMLGILGASIHWFASDLGVESFRDVSNGFGGWIGQGLVAR